MKLKKRILLLLIAGMCSFLNIQYVLAVDTQGSVIEYQFNNQDLQQVGTIYGYDARSHITINTDNPVNVPQYLIYADQKMTSVQEAEQLLKELNIIDNIEKTVGVAYIINPIEDDYTEKDAQLIVDMISELTNPTSNLKIIGIGNGATFVNQYVTQYDWGIAGILTIGGEAGETPKYSVPAYVSNSNNDVVQQYVNGNKNETNKYAVVESGQDESLSEAFSNAWEKVFKHNGRFGNVGGTFYVRSYAEEREFEYTDYIMTDDLGFTRNVVEQDIDQDGIDNLWYEYFPKGTLEAKNNSVPVVLLLHGGGNDPRTQYLTSGWAKVAAENKVALICPNLSSRSIDGKRYDGMSDGYDSSQNDYVTLLNILFEKYPQLDKSKVYVEGLSAGGADSFTLGVTATEMFTAIGVHSGSTYESYYPVMLESMKQKKDDFDMPFIFFVGTEDYLHPIKITEDNIHMLSVTQLYQTINDLPVTQLSDLNYNLNPLFGIPLDNYGLVKNTGTRNIYGGTLTNESGIQISLNAIDGYGHWNYEADAQLMWDFFNQYTKDPKTGKVVLQQNINQPNDENTTPSDENKNPTKPDQSNDSHNPTQTVDTQTPSTNNHLDNADKSNNHAISTNDSVKTDDDSNPFIFIVGACLGVAGIGYVVYLRKRTS